MVEERNSPPRPLIKGCHRAQDVLVLFLCIFNVSLVFNINGNESLRYDDEEFWNPAPLAATPPAVPLGNHSRALTGAVTAMRCLTTPGCYPGIKCAGGDKPRYVAVKGKWESHSFCTGDLAASPSASASGGGDGALALSGERCLVYSFGINDKSQWEEKMARLFGCDVYAFDPTSNFPETIAPRVTFHKMGLQGEGTDVSTAHSESYNAIDASRLRKLSEIVRFLGHQGREIDVLRLDCEGCKYGVLKELACNGDSQLVKQLMIKFQFQKNLGLFDEEDVLIAADAINCLEEERWGIVSMQKKGVGPSDQAYTNSALRVIKGPFFLLDVTMRRVPQTEKLVWELYGDYVKAGYDVMSFEGIHRRGDDWLEKLTEDAKKDYSSKLAIERTAYRKYISLANNRGAVFDKNFTAFSEPPRKEIKKKNKQNKMKK